MSFGRALLAVREQLRRPLRANTERWADYLASVADEPTEVRAGTELWRVGLIPDAGGEGLADRLVDNRQARLHWCIQPGLSPRLANV